MKRTTTVRDAGRSRSLLLQCPECTHTVRVARDELVEGATAYCQRCGNESELSLGLNGETGEQEWLLLDPLADSDDDGEERR